ncbi:RNA-directed DNA polymerase from mobile element jockey [Caerostris extrusa]|uniref:RNA-directed DNA polymerase from mobile element jockey n=1 Tax=Caerostris extrusa TaxID=172846 RepID=A0AAV4NYV6_CAEEX|nr:RNA-directed DNA polymerase from mobile element jockey [Caerostris extrusa]
MKALRRRAQNSIEENTKQHWFATYKKEKAIMRKMVLKAKTISWKKFCTETKSRYGPLYKTAFDKFFKPPTISKTIESDNSTLNVLNILQHLFQPDDMQKDNSYHQPIRQSTTKEHLYKQIKDSTPHITEEEINYVIQVLPKNKAPGPDGLDGNIINLLHKAQPRILISLFNKCLELHCFPTQLKYAEVVLFNKKFKDPSDPNSYRPISLLPTIGKVFEKIILNRLQYHYYINKLLHHNQFGFQSSISTEHALQHMMKKIYDNRKSSKYTILISIDIKGAFDSIWWPSILNTLRQDNTPSTYIILLRDYLNNRNVEFNYGQNKIHYELQKGCPQGSCLGPFLWSIIANKILKTRWDEDVELQAFADDFIFVITSENRRDLENKATKALQQFAKWATEEKLTISKEKTQALILGKKGNIKRKPILRYEGWQVKCVNNLKYLGITIDKNLNFISHLQQLKKDLLLQANKLAVMSGRNWGVNPKLTRLWYKTVAERKICYAASTWAENLNTKKIAQLSSIQRLFTLRITRAYRTSPSSALLILSGIPPLHLTVKKEAIITNVTRLGKNDKFGSTHFNTADYDTQISQWTEPPWLKPSTAIENHLHSSNLTIFTDGSKINNQVGSAFVAYKTDKEIFNWQAKLDNKNSVYQAELLAIFKALQWAKQNDFSKICIKTDSMSSIQAIRKFFNKNSLVQKIRNIIQELRAKQISIEWIKAHSGIMGNEKS